eukprot:scaffold3051_cov167-Ochromonas_danica.AAC.9
MYIWRGKNSRDKRNLLLLGEAGWTANTEDRSHALEDEALRCAKEVEHVQYFREKVSSLMASYLDSADGKKEIDSLRRELDRRGRQSVGEKSEDDPDLMKRSIHAIFKEFTVSKDSDDIDRAGLQGLMSHLGMSASEKQFKAYLRRLHFTAERETVTFEAFYKGKNMFAVAGVLD